MVRAMRHRRRAGRTLALGVLRGRSSGGSGAARPAEQAPLGDLPSALGIDSAGSPGSQRPISTGQLISGSAQSGPHSASCFPPRLYEARRMANGGVFPLYLSRVCLSSTKKPVHGQCLIRILIQTGFNLERVLYSFGELSYM